MTLRQKPLRDIDSIRVTRTFRRRLHPLDAYALTPAGLSEIYRGLSKPPLKWTRSDFCAVLGKQGGLSWFAKLMLLTGMILDRRSTARDRRAASRIRARMLPRPAKPPVESNAQNNRHPKKVSEVTGLASATSEQEENR